MRGAACQSRDSWNGIKGTYSISISSISEARTRKGTLDVPILGRTCHRALAITPIIKTSRLLPVDGGETLFPIDARPFFSPIFLRPDAC